MAATDIAWPRPIPVSERLPERDEEAFWGTPVLAYDEDMNRWYVAAVAYASGKQPTWFSLRSPEPAKMLHAVTHWLQLPPAP